MSNKSGNKFFHQLQDFGAPQVAEDAIEEEEIEDLPPPPPTFSEEDLENAKKAAFEEGRKQALEDAKATDLRKIQELVSKFMPELNALKDAENLREKRFEDEVSLVSLKIFETLFPVFMRDHGRLTLENAVRDILSAQQGQNKIEISLNPSDKALIEKNLSDLFIEAELTFMESENTPENACMMKWNNGGARFDLNAIGAQIHEILTQSLEESGLNSHDEEVSATIEDNMAETDENGTEFANQSPESHDDNKNTQDAVDQPPEEEQNDR